MLSFAATFPLGPPATLIFSTNFTIEILAVNSPVMNTSELVELSRPFKRKRFYRKRVNADGSDGVSPASPPSQPASLNVLELESNVDQNTQPSPISLEAGDDLSSRMAEILRQRKAAQRRKGGVEFTSALASTLDSTPSTALVRNDENETPEDIKSVISRFVPQTGQVTEETDKHMYDQPS